MNATLAELQRAGLATIKQNATGGRAEERWYAVAETDVMNDEDDDFDEESRNGQLITIKR